MSSNEEVKSNDEERSMHGCGPFRHRRRFWMFPFFGLAFLAAKSALVLLIWNELIPDLFHGPALSFLQAFELMVLAKLLVGFGSFGGGFRGRHGPPWRSRWAKLSPEEREKLRTEIRNRCGE